MRRVETDTAPIPTLRPRSWPIVLVAVVVATWGWTVHTALGAALSAFAIALIFRGPSPEDELSQWRGERLRRHSASIRRARAAEPLRPRGEVDVDGARRRARMLDGHAEAGAELEVVNEVDGELVVRRLEHSDRSRAATLGGSCGDGHVGS